MTGPVLILAGGQGRRMGGNKPFRPFLGDTLLARVASRLAGQGTPLVLNAPGDPARFPGWLLVPDTLPGQLGPLAGVLAGLEWLQANPHHGSQLLTVPCDAPFLPRDLALRLRTASGDTPIVVAASAGRDHPVVALWSVALAGPLRQALQAGTRAVRGFSSAYDTRIVGFETGLVDPFMNVNDRAELAAAEALAARHPELA